MSCDAAASVDGELGDRRLLEFGHSVIALTLGLAMEVAEAGNRKQGHFLKG